MPATTCRIFRRIFSWGLVQPVRMARSSQFAAGCAMRTGCTRPFRAVRPTEGSHQRAAVDGPRVVEGELLERPELLAASEAQTGDQALDIGCAHAELPQGAIETWYQELISFT